MSNSTTSRPMRYRAASYHAAFIESGTLAKAAELGFNTVELQIEGETMKGFEALRKKADAEGFLQEAKNLGLEIAIWTHELSGYDPAVHGQVDAHNENLWRKLSERYRMICREMFPEMDYLVLTVVEAQHNITDPDILCRLVEILNTEARSAGKTLIFRSFVWNPDDLEQVVAAMNRMPEEVWFHTKYMPQDWHFRSVSNLLIGRFPGRVEIVEYGVAGEYIRERHLATCAADHFAEHHRLWVAKGVDGICVRVNRFTGKDRDSNSAFSSLQESNLWVTVPLAAGKQISVEEGLLNYAAKRFGQRAAQPVVEALRPTGEVNVEALCVENETFGDPRNSVPAESTFKLPETIDTYRNRWHQNIKTPPGIDLNTAAAVAYPDEEDFMHRNPFFRTWSVWRWDSRYVPPYQKMRRGDQEIIIRKEHSYLEARKVAENSIRKVEEARELFDDPEAYRFLHWRLSENLWHLDVMTACALAWLNAAGCLYTNDDTEIQERRRTARGWLSQVSALDEKARSEKASIVWLGIRRDLQRGQYMDLQDFLAHFKAMWSMSPEA